MFNNYIKLLATPNKSQQENFYSFSELNMLRDAKADKAQKKRLKDEQVEKFETKTKARLKSRSKSFSKSLDADKKLSKNEIEKGQVKALEIQTKNESSEISKTQILQDSNKPVNFSVLTPNTKNLQLFYYIRNLQLEQKFLKNFDSVELQSNNLSYSERLLCEDFETSFLKKRHLKLSVANFSDKLEVRLKNSEVNFSYQNKVIVQQPTLKNYSCESDKNYTNINFSNGHFLLTFLALIVKIRKIGGFQKLLSIVKIKIGTSLEQFFQSLRLKCQNWISRLNRMRGGMDPSYFIDNPERVEMAKKAKSLPKEERDKFYKEEHACRLHYSRSVGATALLFKLIFIIMGLSIILFGVIIFAVLQRKKYLALLKEAEKKYLALLKETESNLYTTKSCVKIKELIDEFKSKIYMLEQVIPPTKP